MHNYSFKNVKKCWPRIEKYPYICFIHLHKKANFRFKKSIGLEVRIAHKMIFGLLYLHYFILH